MKPAAFKYFAPRSLDEALEQLAEAGDEGRPLAGGQSLVPLMNLRMARPGVLVDLNRVEELSYVRESDGRIEIGTMVRQGTAEHHALIRDKCPLLAEAISLMGHTTVRNRGTVGGSIAHADPCAELPAAAAVLGAEMVVGGRDGTRVLPAEEFFLDSLYTAIEPGEMLCEIRVPVMAPSSCFAFVETGVRKNDLAIAGIAAIADISEAGIWSNARVVALGGGACPIRLKAVEAALSGEKIGTSDIAEIAALTSEDIDPTSDLQASADYRRTVLPNLAENALQKCLSMAFSS